jgi:hypoxanthine phosphoribosyltransferase
VRSPASSPVGPPSIQRIFDHRRIWRLDQPTFVAAAALIARHEARHQPQLVIGVARGGVPLANFVGRQLGIDIGTISARHNRSDDLYVQASGHVVLSGEQPGLGEVPAGRRVLVVDDICGTGATFAAVANLLGARLAPNQLRTAVLCRNAAATNRPDVWIWDTRDWVVFPWERPTDQPTEALPAPTSVTWKERR